jgi:hypothetical protein
MVQTEEQYIFIHDAVLDAAQSGSTEVPAVKLKQHIETNIHAITQVSTILLTKTISQHSGQEHRS